jgi:hypothetical protein
MKKIILAIMLVASSSTIAYNYGNTSNQSYQSSTGTRYQYDLSTPGDQIEYSMNTAAQIRDSINITPSKSIDRSMGQYGGGIYSY